MIDLRARREAVLGTDESPDQAARIAAVTGVPESEVRRMLVHEPRRLGWLVRQASRLEAKARFREMAAEEAAWDAWSDLLYGEGEPGDDYTDDAERALYAENARLVGLA
jgi:hypothetical protein